MFSMKKTVVNNNIAFEIRVDFNKMKNVENAFLDLQKRLRQASNNLRKAKQSISDVKGLVFVDIPAKLSNEFSGKITNYPQGIFSVINLETFKLSYVTLQGKIAAKDIKVLTESIVEALKANKTIQKLILKDLDIICLKELSKFNFPKDIVLSIQYTEEKKLEQAKEINFLNKNIEYIVLHEASSDRQTLANKILQSAEATVETKTYSKENYNDAQNVDSHYTDDEDMSGPSSAVEAEKLLVNNDQVISTVSEQTAISNKNSNVQSNFINVDVEANSASEKEVAKTDKVIELNSGKTLPAISANTPEPTLSNSQTSHTSYGTLFSGIYSLFNVVEKEMESLKSTCDELKKDMLDSNEKINEYQLKLKQTEAKLEAKTLECEKLKKDVESLEKMAQYRAHNPTHTSGDWLAKIVTEREKLQNDNNFLNQKITQLESDLLNSKNEYAALFETVRKQNEQNTQAVETRTAQVLDNSDEQAVPFSQSAYYQAQVTSSNKNKFFSSTNISEQGNQYLENSYDQIPHATSSHLIRTNSPQFQKQNSIDLTNNSFLRKRSAEEYEANQNLGQLSSHQPLQKAFKINLKSSPGGSHYQANLNRGGYSTLPGQNYSSSNLPMQQSLAQSKSGFNSLGAPHLAHANEVHPNYSGNNNYSDTQRELPQDPQNNSNFTYPKSSGY